MIVLLVVALPQVKVVRSPVSAARTARINGVVIAGALVAPVDRESSSAKTVEYEDMLRPW
ncbi:hypothetical protein QA641_22485 [Bradyrhizobium sp. CB1650]|uniref:hypothetical protein n=1 Tax=Bradyrhizobium sp. CB1650 TaxID=3039153 RepID=UPI002434FEBD|nr:hypothetical protein [Bradyrhizobium sp. CB1650]WGD56425.1 hypothetical protein QA641_22485 [Bradyrhizobium sp. CB1650]